MISPSILNRPRFFKSISVVDAVLAEDPSGVYSSMDFNTQESYRRVVERVAKRTKASEMDVAQHAIRLALESRQAGSCERAHVGYYLIDDGLQKLERAFNYRHGLAERAGRVVFRHPTSTYLVAHAAITAFLVIGCVGFALRSGANSLALVGVAFLSLFPASEIASVGLRLTLMRVFRPRLLPRIDTSSGLPNEATTMVVVSTTFSSSMAVRESLETIEAHYLANQDSNIFFALLADWNAAPQEKMPDDCALLAAAASGIKQLNARYNEGPGDRFHLFHRRRLWNQSEGRWVGWERYGGKLRELNHLLRGARDTTYTTCTADSAFLKRIRYVISLDSDTELPRDSARKLVGAILHPLNRPRLDARTRGVIHGYGILQPLVGEPPPKARRSRVPGILSVYADKTPGTNLFAAAVPNVYQDLFSEGNYIPKALYEVDTFEAALRDCVPERSLSHDLLKGLLARTALVTDVEIFEQSPSNYLVQSSRTHSCTQSAWQLLPWLLPRVKDARGNYVRNGLPVMGRWKIINNLRHSLIKPVILLWLVAAWTILPGEPASWTKLILLMFVAPFYLHFIIELLLQVAGKRQAALAAKAWAGFKISASEALFSIVYLAHQAYLMTDAITRTLYRTVISRKHLLEWDTAAQSNKESPISLRLFISYMWPVSVIALMGVALLAAKAGPAFRSAAPVLLAWFASPLFAYWSSRRMRRASEAIEEKTARDVRLNARCTLRLLETSLAYTLAQTGPKSEAALNASLANCGRFLLWMMSAYELGAIGRLELAKRLESTLAAIENLRFLHRLRGNHGPGHSYGMAALQHALISETGNLAAFLPTLKQRCTELSFEPLYDERVVRGINDTLLLMKQEYLSLNTKGLPREGKVMLYQLKEEMKLCLAFLRAAGQEEAPRTNAAWRRFFNILCQRAAIIEFMLNSFSQKYPTVNAHGLRFWTAYLMRQAQELNRELDLFVPWTSMRISRMAPTIRKQGDRALALWNSIVEGLDRPSAISDLPEELYDVLMELEGLCRQLNQSFPPDTTERETVLEGCEQLRGAIQDALRASNDLHSCYTSLANRCQAVVNATNFRPLFDQEHKLLRSQFQVSMAG